MKKLRMKVSFLDSWEGMKFGPLRTKKMNIFLKKGRNGKWILGKE